MIYLDAAATTPVRRDVVEAMWPYLTGDFGNPSSTHAIGGSAADALQRARATVASWLGCRASEVIFTSGGTEADNLAIKGIALASPRGRHIVTTRLEHDAVLESVAYLERLHGFSVTYLGTDRFGRVAPDGFNRALRDDTTLASVMFANNEVGTVQPIAELTAIARARGVPFHTDAVQAAGWVELNVRTLGVDALSMSGHKLGAPKGVGLLYLRGRVHVEPIMHGGGQERARRSGTENVAYAVGLAAAISGGQHDVTAKAAAAVADRDAFVANVLAAVPGAELTGHPSERLPALASFVFPGTGGESVLLELERRGMVGSSGSACAAGRDEASHVLLALGYPEDVARTAVRFSWGSEVDGEQLDRVVQELHRAVVTISSLAD